MSSTGIHSPGISVSGGKV